MDSIDYTHTHKGFLLSLNTVLTRVSGTADLISALFSFFREVFSPPIPPSPPPPPPPRTHTQEVLAQFQHGFDSFNFTHTNFITEVKSTVLSGLIVLTPPFHLMVNLFTIISFSLPVFTVTHFFLKKIRPHYYTVCSDYQGILMQQ